MVVVTAKNIVKQDKLQEALEICKQLVIETRKELGCIKYDVYQDEQNSNIITMIEEWENKTYLENHFLSEHFKKLVPMLGECCINDTEVNIYTKVI